MYRIVYLGRQQTLTGEVIGSPRLIVNGSSLWVRTLFHFLVYVTSSIATLRNCDVATIGSRTVTLFILLSVSLREKHRT